jgi:invasion protein IalB
MVWAMITCRPLALTALVLAVTFALFAGGAVAAKKSGGAVHAAAAAPTERLGAAQSWTAYSYRDASGKVCYLIASPQKSEPSRSKRKRPVAMVTHRPEEKAANVVSLVEGYPLKEGDEVALDIDGTKFELFTKGDSAWARTADLDKTIVEAMVKGRQAVVKGTPQKGPPTTDTYSLSGFAQALALIDKACDVKR